MKQLIFAYIAVFSLLLVSACGFKPVYTSGTGAEGVSVSDALSYVKIEPIPDRAGVLLTNALIDRFYKNETPANAKFRLVSKVTEKRIVETGIARDATTTREQIRLGINTKLISNSSSKILFDRDFVSYTNYNILSSEYATVVAKEDAMRRAVEQIADDIVTQLSLYLSYE